VCREVRPELLELLPGHAAACHVAARAVTGSGTTISREATA
jgi:hypothetical protein